MRQYVSGLTCGSQMYKVGDTAVASALPIALKVDNLYGFDLSVRLQYGPMNHTGTFVHYVLGTILSN